MARITETVLKDAIKHVNDRMQRAGAEYSYRYRGNNGYHIVDAYKGDRNLFMVGMGTAKECIGALYSDAFDRMGDAYIDRLRESAAEFTPITPAGTCGRCGSTPGMRDATCPECTDPEGNDILTPNGLTHTIQS
jgi:hypothetical protein